MVCDQSLGTTTLICLWPITLTTTLICLHYLDLTTEGVPLDVQSKECSEAVLLDVAKFAFRATYQVLIEALLAAGKSSCAIDTAKIIGAGE